MKAKQDNPGEIVEPNPEEIVEPNIQTHISKPTIAHVIIKSEKLQL